jgi:ABC-type branched-subunit amino acid transport system substrate-binding protein
VDFLDHAKRALNQKIERVAIMYTDDDWGRASIAKGAGEALKNRGYQVVEEIAYPSASQDVTTYINRVKAARPDAFIVTSFPVLQRVHAVCSAA